MKFLITLFSFMIISLPLKAKEMLGPVNNIRPPAIAGAFYPASEKETAEMIKGFFKDTKPLAKGEKTPKAIISPHAGLVYSGPVAAKAYAKVAHAKGQIKKVVIIGPSHRVPFKGIALSGKSGWKYHNSIFPIDSITVNKLSRLPFVQIFDKAHEQEHSLEIQLPFIKEALGSVQIIPAVIGNATDEEVSAFINKAWGKKDTLFVISSDLSHYHKYNKANLIDSNTARNIENFDFKALSGEDACGFMGIRGMLNVAKEYSMKIKRIELKNSGDTSGNKDRVVGYGAWTLTETKDLSETGKMNSMEKQDLELLEKHKELLFKTAAESIRYGFKEGEPKEVDIDDLPKELAEDRAVFVTLEKNGRLRGCIGSIVAHRPLLEDISINAFNAAFSDHRFNKLTKEEFKNIDISISLLSKPVYMSFTDEADFMRQLRPNVDGIIFSDRGYRSVYLPIVWEQLPDPKDFMARLKIKAGLPPNHWSDTVEIKRFTANAIKLHDMENPERFLKE